MKLQPRSSNRSDLEVLGTTIHSCLPILRDRVVVTSDLHLPGLPCWLQAPEASEGSLAKGSCRELSVTVGWRPCTPSPEYPERAWSGGYIPAALFTS